MSKKHTPSPQRILGESGRNLESTALKIQARSISDDRAELLELLTEVHGLREVLDRTEQAIVDRLRPRGASRKDQASWVQIAAAVGSQHPQVAYNLWGHKREERPRLPLEKRRTRDDVPGFSAQQASQILHRTWTSIVGPLAESGEGVLEVAFEIVGEEKNGPVRGRGGSPWRYFVDVTEGGDPDRAPEGTTMSMRTSTEKVPGAPKTYHPERGSLWWPDAAPFWDTAEPGAYRIIRHESGRPLRRSDGEL